MMNSEASNLFLTYFLFKCLKNRFLINFRCKKVTSFKASPLPDFLSRLFKPFDLSHCSKPKLFNTIKNTTVKVGVPK